MVSTVGADGAFEFFVNPQRTGDLILGPDIVFGGNGTQQWEGIDLTTVSALGASLYFQSATLDLSVLSDSTRTSNGVAITTGLY